MNATVLETVALPLGVVGGESPNDRKGPSTCRSTAGRGVRARSYAQYDQRRVISVERMGGHLGSVTPRTLARVDARLRIRPGV